MLKLTLTTALAVFFAAGLVREADADEIVVSAQAFTQGVLTRVLDDFGFTRETGNTIRFESSSAGTEDIAKLTTAFRGGHSPYDVLMASDELFASFVDNGWLAPLDDVFDAGLASDFPDNMKQAMTVWSQKNGHTYRVPFEFGFSIYWTRSDMLKEFKVKPPASWEDLEANAKVARARGVYGFADALGKGGFGYVYLANLTIQAGGNPFACDTGYRTAVEWTKKQLDAGHFPKAAINMTYDQLNQEYLNNKILTVRQWPYFFSVTRDNKNFYADGKADVVLPPKGPAGAKVWTGGHGWSVPTSAPHQTAAKQFVKFITRPEVQIALAKANSFFVVPRKSLLMAMGNDTFVGILNTYLQADAFTTRPFHPQLVAAQGVVEDAAHAYWTGQMNLDDAVAFCKSQIAALGQ